MYVVWRDPTPGKREALEDLTYFCHGLLQSRGWCNGNKGTYHHCTQGIGGSMAHEDECETYTDLGQESSEEIIEHNSPATRQAF